MEWGIPVSWGWFLLFQRSEGHKTKETHPTKPGSPIPCKQGLRACLHEGGGPRVGEVTWGGLPHLTCKHDHIKMRDYMDRRVIPPKWVTSPIWGTPPPCKQALIWQIYNFCPTVSTSRQPTTREVGIGSNGQDFLADLRMSAETSFSERGWKEWKACAASTSWSGGSALRVLGSMSTASISKRILAIFRTKTPPMSLACFDLSW